MKEDRRFAVLIDADNISDKYIEFIFDELSNAGSITYKRIYGDWTNPALKHWKSILLNFSITPIQQYGYTVGKNATDSAMIIDAMDILYAGNVEGFCIVSSDSDFTRLASRLRESGMVVVGMGEKKTPSAFVAACTEFKYLEVLAKEPFVNAPPVRVNAGATKKLPDEKPEDREDVSSLESVILPLWKVERTIQSIVEETSDEDGWIPLSHVGNILTKRFPNFDVRNYGFKKLVLFVKSLKSFEMKSVSPQNSNITHYYIRRRDCDVSE